MDDLLRSVAFQFHKGTIKTRSTVPILFAISSFQFHKGTIKTYSPETTETHSS